MMSVVTMTQFVHPIYKSQDTWDVDSNLFLDL